MRRNQDWYETLIEELESAVEELPEWMDEDDPRAAQAGWMRELQADARKAHHEDDQVGS